MAPCEHLEALVPVLDAKALKQIAPRVLRALAQIVLERRALVICDKPRIDGPSLGAQGTDDHCGWRLVGSLRFLPRLHELRRPGQSWQRQLFDARATVVEPRLAVAVEVVFDV